MYQVVPRRRLKQFAINFPRVEGNGAGQGTKRGVVKQEGYRKDLEQGFWKESIRGKPISFSVVAVLLRLSETLCAVLHRVRNSFQYFKRILASILHDNTYF